MMWDHVMKRVVALILADTAMSNVCGAAVRMAGTGDLNNPVLEYFLITDGENELWAPFEIQFDLWTQSAQVNRDGERRLKQLFHRDVPYVLDDINIRSWYNDGAMLATPNRSNFHGRGLRFWFTPLREQYAEL
jgi:hypothetical protein